jgi:hypothetical protein
VAVSARWLLTGLPRRVRTEGRERILAALWVAVCLAVAVMGLDNYWRFAHDGPLAQIAFEAGERRAWEEISAKRKPAQRVFVNGAIPYAIYYEMFFLKPQPVAMAAGGGEEQGIIFFDPRQTEPALREQALAAGDWIMEPVAPDRIRVGNPPRPWLSPQEALRANEAWVIVRQKR